MNLNEIAALAPVGPHIEGLIRFARTDGTQLPEFELLTHVHATEPVPGEVPSMRTHPLSDSLRAVDNDAGTKRLLTEVPIRFIFDKPENNLSATYKAFQRSTGALLCCGNGEKASRRPTQGQPTNEIDCAGPEHCPYANQPEVACQLNVRLKVQVVGSTDPLAVFEFQSSGLNSYRSLSAKLKMMHALFGGLRGLPLRLTSWEKSTPGSSYLPFHCANVELEDGLDIVDAKTQADAFRAKTSSLAFEAMEASVEAKQQSPSFRTDETESVVSCWTSESTSGKSLSVQGTLAGTTPSTKLADLMSGVMTLAHAQKGAAGSAVDADSLEALAPVANDPEVVVTPTTSERKAVDVTMELTPIPNNTAGAGEPGSYDISYI